MESSIVGWKSTVGKWVSQVLWDGKSTLEINYKGKGEWAGMSQLFLWQGNQLYREISEPSPCILWV